MTNERAVEILNLDLDILGQYGGETAEAYKMAIQALEAQPTDAEREAYIKGYDYGVKDWFKSKTQPCEDAVSRTLVHEAITASIAESENPYEMWQRIEALPSVTPRINLALTSQDCISREEMLKYQQYLHGKMSNEENHKLWNFIKGLPSVTPQYTDEEIDKAQSVEQAYVDKMVELTVEELRREWLNSFDTSSATKCFEAVNILKERLEHEET